MAGPPKCHGARENFCPFLPPLNGPADRHRVRDTTENISTVTLQVVITSLSLCMQVLRLLEVPGEKVTASSAAFALQRLSQLCSATGNDDMDSFVRKAVLRELCETVVLGLAQLPNSTIVSLTGQAALASSGYDAQFVHHVNNEVSI